MEVFPKYRINCEDGRMDEVVVMRRKLLGLLGIIIFFMVVFIAYTVYIEKLQDKKLDRLLRIYPELEDSIVDIYFNDDSGVYNDENTDNTVWESGSDNADTYDGRNKTEISDIKDKYGYERANLITNKVVWLYLAGVIFLILSAVLIKWRIEDKILIKRQKNEEIIFDLLCSRLEYMKETILISDIESVDGSVYTDASTQFELEQSETYHIGSSKPGSSSRTARENWYNVFDVLKELDNNLLMLRERYAEEENNTKSLITDLSHQLKTPLASLKMSHELMLSEDLSDKERKEFFEQEGREIDKLEQLLQELIKVSRLENHMIHIEPIEQSIKSTIADAVSMVYGKAKGKGIQISVNIDKDYIVLHDRTWTAEAIENILDNAIKYSPDNSFVDVRVRELATNILIEIEDQGIGIAKDEYHKIFERFYRGKEASSNVKEGAGVGLYLARMIIEYQNGTITVKNNMGQGSVFQIIIPK